MQPSPSSLAPGRKGRGGNTRASDSEPAPILIGQRRVGLSRREWDIGLLVAAGKSNKEIAATLGIAPPTVASSLRCMFRQLGVDRRAAMVAVLATKFPEIWAARMRTA